MNRPYLLIFLIPVLAVCSCVSQQGRALMLPSTQNLNFALPPLNVAKANKESSYSDVWAKIRSNTQLFFDYDNSRITKQRENYLKHPHYFEKVTKQAEPFAHYITNEVTRRELPSELALLPFVESAFQINAKSPNGAAGLWQFMPMTARHLKMSNTRLFDARYDIVDSTESALNYLTWLHKQLDEDWLLALAAYNAGLGTVRKAIKKNQKKNKPTDFWHLKLPKETMDYVPRLLALQSLIDAPEAYGVKLAPIPDQPYFISIGTQQAVDLDKVADFLSTSKSDIALLNSGYRLKRTPHKKLSRLLLPEKFSLQLTNHAIEELEIVASASKEPTQHLVKKGETLSNICQNYKISMADLIKLNNLKNNKIKMGQQLLIPQES